MDIPAHRMGEVVTGDLPRLAARPRRWAFPAGVALVILVMLYAIASDLSSGRRAVRAMPDMQRAAAYARTMDDLQRLCGPERADALREHCRELATFALQFPECREECDALVRRQLTPPPTR